MRYQVIFLENDEWKNVEGAIFCDEKTAEKFACKHAKDFSCYTDVDEISEAEFKSASLQDAYSKMAFIAHDC